VSLLAKKEIEACASSGRTLHVLLRVSQTSSATLQRLGEGNLRATELHGAYCVRGGALAIVAACADLDVVTHIELVQ
jgi:hypothetical protein